VGSINVDLVVRAGRLPSPGETVSGGTFERHGGGKGANQALAAARAGADVAFIGAVGRDEFGELSVHELEQEGIDVSGVARPPAVATGVALIVVDAQGENQIAVAPGANAAVEPAAVTGSLQNLGPDTIALLGLELTDAPLAAAARCFTRAGIRTVIVNPAPARTLPGELLELRPILTPNAVEARFLTGIEDAEGAARELHARTEAPVVVTLGGDGALLVQEGVVRRMPAVHVDAVDTTGAGDAFNGALAAGLAQGYDLDAALGRALAASSSSVRAAGARGGMPRRDEIDRLVSATRGSIPD
jgi:ribokinase